jgi:GDP-mannose 6-dehydrogenase
MVKYTANAFHALKICFANEVAEISEALGADGREVMRLFLMDRRLNVSEAYLRPGFAFGGSCLPKDVRALVYAARAADVEAPLLSSILPSNEAQIRRGLQEVLAAQKRRVGMIGLAFKPGSDDVRESPLVTLVETLIGKGYDVRVLDRSVALANLVGANRSFLYEKIPHIARLLCRSVEALVAHAEVLVIGHRGEDAARALAAVGPHQIVVDLTRDIAARAENGSAYGEALLGLG